MTAVDEQTAAGPQGTHEVWRTARTHPRGVTEEALGPIVETQRVQQEGGGATTLLKNAPHHGPRVPPGDGGQPPLSGPGVVKDTREHVERPGLTGWHGEHPSVTPPGAERREGDVVVSRRPPLLLAILEKTANALCVAGVGTTLVVLEPVAQMGDQAPLLLGCGVGVPVLGELPGQPVDGGYQGPAGPWYEGKSAENTAAILVVSS